ncbi:hypothetical protein, partial [Bacteroides acidifaciens]|uniref:hypothetical protein n=1 Tax=Bacteroides acidifaciens TaxID=85831 RepID=UPI0026749A4C
MKFVGKCRVKFQNEESERGQIACPHSDSSTLLPYKGWLLRNSPNFRYTATNSPNVNFSEWV